MHSDPSIEAAKKRLRKHAAEARRLAHATLGARGGEQLARIADVLSVPPHAVVAGYWPLPGEIDPIPLMARLAQRGCRLTLPVVVERGHRLVFRAWAPGDPLEPGEHGTFHPLPEASELVPSLVLVPLLAFDRRGFRLGYGGGYYDRTLESLRRSAHLTTIGVGFAAQEVPSVPVDPHDQRLDGVATENGLIMVDGK
jgi:5-formyltetrahydrofolate cyclo-ligase